MRLLSVNIGSARAVQVGPRAVSTGIYKTPVAHPVRVGKLGLETDTVSDQKHHGGPDQAVYVYSADDYAWWALQLGHPFEPGTFGENLTFSTFGPEPVRIGERFRVGAVLLEVTAPRIPCGVFAARMGDPGWVKKFKQAARPGFYARVLEEGVVRAGERLERIPTQADYPTLQDLFTLWYESSPDPAKLHWVLQAPLAIRARREYEERLKAKS
jgi:MOSC domain-containing protein YiiM